MAAACSKFFFNRWWIPGPVAIAFTLLTKSSLFCPIFRFGPHNNPFLSIWRFLRVFGLSALFVQCAGMITKIRFQAMDSIIKVKERFLISKNVNFLRHPINGKDCDYGNDFLTEKLEKNITVFSSISWKNRCLNIELRNDFVVSSIVTRVPVFLGRWSISVWLTLSTIGNLAVRLTKNVATALLIGLWKLSSKRTKLEHCVITFETQVTIELYSSPFSMCMRQSNNENDTIILFFVVNLHDDHTKLSAKQKKWTDI